MIRWFTQPFHNWRTFLVKIRLNLAFLSKISFGCINYEKQPFMFVNKNTACENYLRNRIPISRFGRKLKKSDLNCEQIVNKTLLKMSNGVDLYRQFLTLHQNQLQTSVVPEHLWPTLFKKLVEGVSLYLFYHFSLIRLMFYKERSVK